MKVLALLLEWLLLGPGVIIYPPAPYLKHWVIVGCHLEQLFLLDALEYNTVLDQLGIQENIIDDFETETPACS